MTTSGQDSSVGRLLDGRYRLGRPIADGGMATVWLATDERLGRPVAIKILRSDLSRDREFADRFRREAHLSAALPSHPNVVSYYDFVQDEGDLCIVMEYVPGHTLRDAISTRGPIPLREAIRVYAKVLAALAEAHRHEVIHRDVKPENVLIGSGDAVKVTDFGLARAVTSSTRTSSTGVVMGTVSYLAPEQLSGERADARSDVYSAGLILYELLTGAKAFPGQTPAHVIYQIVHGNLPRASDAVSSVPLEIDALIRHACALEPDDRPATAGEMLQRLQSTTRQLSEAELDAEPEIVAGSIAATAAAERATEAADVSPQNEHIRTDHAAPQPTSVLPLSSPTQRMPLPQREEEQPQSAPEPPTRYPVREAEPTTVVTRERSRRRWWLLPLLLALVVGGALGWKWYDGSGPGSERVVPALRHLLLADAQNALSQQGLGWRVSEVFDEAEPKGQVISADPGSGTTVRKGDVVTLAVSKGPERYAVPTLTGRARADAEAALAAVSLKAGQVGEEFSDTVPAGVVTRQDPAPDTQVKRDTAVAFVVSKGKEPIPVPDFTGKPVAEAQKVLQAAGFKVTVAEAVNSDTVPEGAVVTQAPAQGTLVKGDPVTLTPSKGPVMVPVPQVQGLQREEAADRLRALGFKVAYENVLGGIFGTVRDSRPRAGTLAPKGSTVTLVIV